MKEDRREVKRTAKRNITGEEVIFVFEKVLEGWKTIKIYNTLIQNNPKYMKLNYHQTDTNIIQV